MAIEINLKLVDNKANHTANKNKKLLLRCCHYLVETVLADIDLPLIISNHTKPGLPTCTFTSHILLQKRDAFCHFGCKVPSWTISTAGNLSQTSFREKISAHSLHFLQSLSR